MQLEYLIRQGNLQKIKLAIKNGADINEKDEYGRTPIFYAITDGLDEIVELLCKNGAYINIQDIGGKTLLHVAAIYNRYMIIELLFSYGIKTGIVDNYEKNSLSNAVFYFKGDKRIISLLIKKGEDPHLKNNYGVSPSILASNIANFDVTDLLN